MPGQSTAVIPVTGVLQKASDSGPIEAGLKLYRAMAETYNVVLIAGPDEDKDRLEHWLALHGLHQHSHVHYTEAYLVEQLGPFGSWIYTIRALRRRGFMLDIIIEPDPVVAAGLMQDGFTVLAFLHPAYARPEWRPGFTQAVQPWDELIAQVEHDQLVRNKDTRTEDDL